MKYLVSILKSTFPLLTFVSGVFYINSAIAAETVVFKYGIFRETVPVSELTALAETGELSQKLRFFFNQADQDPQPVRNTLTREVNANPVTLDRVLNNRIGIFLLDQISQTIHTPSGNADRQALRSSLVLSASKDKKVSLIEIIQNYPTTEVHIEGKRLVRTYEQLNLLAQWLQNVLYNNVRQSFK
ncbi:MAG: alpha/beta hydrolase [Brasilonema octagenarum HA4186-MV1]|jgi:hypothetical protein|uniref:DUF1400 domain-containing protein n=2 Tax=Brasilonema TaxID=383614 RepID=A0A856MEH4_9CYAN|nr:MULTISPECIES: alpha/beta hydrolase [Brasilonema]MBW4625175.1 alpha/beta hydrolase [Brasilonema octagenarum HA4186-MV1]NMF61809.1 hypothetical protein [Brasilonema octagenarum UFV-OR1]QDL09593.1 hypothetical protein DP114_18360 [Brasilonema sennae CENA114]QDL15949.1 hypothetical protein DP113_18295 [Brasilonema octagenarum UFV-E1]